MEHPYGKTHHELYPHRNRIEEAARRYLDKLRSTRGANEINNLFVDFRNEMYGVVGEIYQHLSVLVETSVNIRPSERQKTIWPKKSRTDACIICGEARIVDKCHIIPREHSGSDSTYNLILLCPTHHFLYDHEGLSEEEFSKINVDDKARDSVEFHEKVRLARHQNLWKRTKQDGTAV